MYYIPECFKNAEVELMMFVGAIGISTTEGIFYKTVKRGPHKV